MNGKTASLFFIIGSLFLVLGIFGEPILSAIKNKLDSIEYADSAEDAGYRSDYELPVEDKPDNSDAAPLASPPPPPPKKMISDAPIFDFAEVAPEYPGGVIALRREVQQAYDIPNAYKNSGSKGGTIVTRFVVLEDGSIDQVQILKGIPDCEACNQKAIEAIQSLSKPFTPGLQAGKPVKVRYTLPIIIKIR